jgi:predicted MPP superfamily phosphohydrolase
MRKYKPVKILIVLMITAIFLYGNNNVLQVTKINISSPKIPESFNGYKIVQISDLHSKEFGSNQKNIIAKIKRLKPDIIVITGDIIDRRRYSETESLTFVREAVKLVPVYYCTGNHEAWSGKFENSLEDKLKNAGAKLLRNESDLLKRGGEVINILGVDDPAFNTNNYIEDYKDSTYMENSIKQVIGRIDTKNYTILLSHRPELINTYEGNKIDIVFSGHGHGGQIRLPFIGGIIAPEQGFFPKYSSGQYKLNECNMIVSRGLGNSIAPFRIFNLPNIVMVTLN